MIPQTRPAQCISPGLLGVCSLLILPQLAGSNRTPDSGVKRGPITVHVLDTVLGKPAPGLAVVLERRSDPGWKELARGRTDDSGRIDGLLEPGTPLPAGIYRITYQTGDYFARRKVTTFYPEVQVIFEVREPNAHHHLPLLLSPYGYTTYRGS